MNETHIEKAATDLLMQIYRDRRYLWPDQDVPPMMMRSPRIAAMVCGYDYHEHPTLGDTQFNRHNTGTHIAGLIDRQSNKIAVATEFGDKVQLFTGAHEIGLLVLHEDTVMHRERAFDGSPLQAPRAPAERQVDRFRRLLPHASKTGEGTVRVHVLLQGPIALQRRDCLSPRSQQSGSASLLPERVGRT